MERRLTIITILVLCTMMLLAQTSKVNVTIDGPGVVDEYLTINADGKKQVKLKAITNKILDGVTFDGWSGDATGTGEELTVDADKVQNIHAKFSWQRPTRKYPLLDLKLPNADHKNYYIEEKCYEFHNPRAWRGSNYIPIDYNRDGYIDFVEFAMKGSFGTNDHRENVRFWLANEDGTFTEDPKNDDKLMGAVFCNRFAYPDLNEDGYPDFCAFSTGYDRDGSTYDHPLILMSDETCTYHEVRYPEHVQYFHGGTSGDFNNDGHVDVLFLSISNFYESVLLVNKGNGILEDTDMREVFKFDDLFAEYNGIAPIYMDCEFTDLNNDGFLDFVLCGSDWFDSDTYNSPPMVFWGDGKSFTPERSAKLLDTPFGYGISHSPVFYDLNGDGVKEIIMTKLGDGAFGGSIFYKGVIHQVFELNGTEYVDKTEQYIPVQYEIKETLRTWMEEIDGRVFLCNGEHDESYTPGVAACPGSFKVYELVDGILEPVYYPTTTKIDTYDEGFAIYADKPTLVDYFNYDDGLNPNDLGVAWGATEQWDGIPSGDMWRIDPHYGTNTHFGNSCIRWNRDGLDPKTEYGKQCIAFNFISEVDIKNLIYEGYYLEFYIKNSDPDLSLLINGVTLDVNNTDEGKFTGEWQRMTCPILKIAYNSDKLTSLAIEVDKGDLNNEFYLDDIRVRRLSISETRDDYERAFRKNYIDGVYYNKERTAQITSQEFKLLLKSLVEKYAPDKMDYFNERISDTDLPLTRNIAVGMAYYTAICIGADTGNYSDNAEQPADFWDGCWEPEVNQVLPHANDEPTSPIGPDDNFWMEWQEIMQAVMWNACHVSEFSGMRVVPIDKDANSYHWLNIFTWEDAICAITRLYDSLDPEKIKATQVSITIGKNGKTTFCGDKALDFSYSDEVKAFIATGFDKTEGTIWMTRVKDVPAGVPVMIKGTANETYHVPVTEGGSSYYKNMFVGNTTGEIMSIGETSEDGQYVNYYMSGGQFKSVKTSANIGANKCYLQLPANFEAEATGDGCQVKIAASGKSSFAAPYDLDFTSLNDDVKAFTATGYDASTKTIWLTRVRKVQKGEGLLLKGTGGETYTIPSSGVQAAYGNMIVGNIGEEITINGTSDDGTLTNYYLKGGTYVSVSGSANIGTNKSYLQLPTSMLAGTAGARSEDTSDVLGDLDTLGYLGNLGMPSTCHLAELETESMPVVFGSIGSDDETTGIKDNNRETITNNRDGQWFTLSGQRIDKPAGKGLYIKDGRKVVMR